MELFKGQNAKQYLSYVIDGGDQYRENDVNEQNSFYTNLCGSSHYAYSETKFENNRAVEQSSLGANYRMVLGHTMKSDVYLNAGGNIKKFMLGSGSITCVSTYAAGKLMVQKATDPDGNESFEYADSKGRLIAKEAKKNATESLFTYYIFSKL